MNVERLTFPAPILCIDDFLTDEDANSVFEECIGLKNVFMPAMVGDGGGSLKCDPTLRKNEVMYLSEIFRTAPERSRIVMAMKKGMSSEEASKVWKRDGLIFDILNYANNREAVVSRFGNCDFFAQHRDVVMGQNSPRRLVTLVYYVNTLPERFTGGSIVFRDGGESVKVQPRHNRAVVFLSSTLHEVEGVQLESDAWEHGRFSINLWAGFREAR
jgi:Rps23 Pro-64 3,4-dihydroxylase Tpa1-like proline 4-hydroxylase